MATVEYSPDARLEFGKLPRVSQARVTTVAERLERWPAVSGAKRLRGDLFGSYRIPGQPHVVFLLQHPQQIFSV